MPGEPPTEGPAPLDPEVLRHAMKAFRKRLKLTRLNEESKLGRNPLTGGRKSAVVGILPPREYPSAVWPELVRQKRLRDAGGGFYELVE